mgnify:CR=1 FL=1
MADPTDPGNASPPAGMAGPPVQVRIVGQYIKDLSFENPTASAGGDALAGQASQKSKRLSTSR